MNFYTYTNAGKREVNEDFCMASSYEDSFCFVLCDGLGGHGGGDVASKCVVSAVSETFMKEGYSSKFFEHAVDNAQTKLLEKQKVSDSWDRMKTTLVILVVDKNNAYYCHVGDSRCYYFKDGLYKLRTLDHSVPQMLVDIKEITEDEIRHHPDRNRLLNVMGSKDSYPEISIGKKIRLSGNQEFLLCSDGFWELIVEKDMEACYASSSSLEEWVDKMVQIIFENGKDVEMDNLTCIVVESNKKGLFGGLL